MAMGDGSIHAVEYEIDLDIHQSRGSRNDGKPAGQ
jgi:hypothetical protein